MLHSQAMITSRMYESYDSRYHHSWDISSSSDGVIQVHEPQKGEYATTHPKPADLHIERDVLENARRRWPAVDIEVREVAVQGLGAVEQVMTALRELDRMPEVDVIVIARGGGSVEDLLPFSD